MGSLLLHGPQQLFVPTAAGLSPQDADRDHQYLDEVDA